MNSLKFKHSKIQLLLLILTFGLTQLVQAQIGINNTNPNPNAALDIKSDSKGLLIPRLSKAQREALALKAVDGLLVYDTIQRMFYFWDGGTKQWESLNLIKNVKNNQDTNIVISNKLKKINVGIGVSVPKEKLEVNGNIKGDTLKANVAQGYGIVPKGSILSWYGTISGNFDGTGNGLGNYAGWAICNGSNGTPNLSGRFIVGYDPGDADYNGLGKPAGEKYHTLSPAEMPYHTHAVQGNTSTDGGHSHTYSVTPYSGPQYNADNPHERNIGQEAAAQTSTDGAHYHSINFSSGSAGSNAAHENRPPYFVLLYIMRIK